MNKLKGDKYEDYVLNKLNFIDGYDLWNWKYVTEYILIDYGFIHDMNEHRLLKKKIKLENNVKYFNCLIDTGIDLLGFDLHSKSNTVNNIYKGTPNYDSADSRAVDPSFWIHQISKLFDHFPNKQFRIFNEESWEMPDSWKKENVSFFNLTQFKEMLKYSDV